MDKRYSASELYAISQYSIPEEIEKALSKTEPLLLSAAQNGCTSLLLSPLYDLGVTDEFAEQHLAEPLRKRGFVVRNRHFGLVVSWAQVSQHLAALDEASLTAVLDEVKLRG
jgi:DNA-binding transcriptional ArsR family regulator